MSVALIQEVRFGIGFKKQADLVTALVAADMVSLRHTNEEIIQAQPINEDDAADLGKGVYITNQYPSHIQAGGPFNGRLTSESGAIISAFGIGKATKATAGDGFKYTCAAPSLATDGLDLPATTMAVQIRTGGSAITDKALIGVCCEEFGVQLKQGKGRDNATFTSQWIGTGKYANPSAITMPAFYDENSLNAGGVTALTLIGFNYLTNLRFVSVDFGWKNNIRDESGYYPGSGSQDGFQVKGRMRRGVPQITLRVTVECDSGSNEEDLLLAQTEGTGVITVVGAAIGAAFHTWKITFHRLTVKAAPIGNTDGIASYSLEYSVMEHASNGVLTIEATTGIDDILVEAS
jgi:hypothetical protein